MTASTTPTGGTTPSGVPYPAITGPAPYNVQLTDPAAFAVEQVENVVEQGVKLIGPTGAAIVGILSDLPAVIPILMEIRDPLNGKNETRLQEAQGYVTQGGAAGLANLIGRYNAGTVDRSQLEPDWFRQYCKFLAVVSFGVPLSAFPS